MQCKVFFILVFSIFLVRPVSGQPDSVIQKNDTAKVYRDIETFSKKRGFTDFVFGLLFRRIESEQGQKKIKRIRIQKPYKTFEGKIIRNIEIITLDPFGYSIRDTSVIVQNKIYKVGNGLHLKTKVLAIRNLLLIHKNELFDSLLVKESERLIRSQKYVQEVSFYTVLTAKNSDSVDIYIRELDLWSIIPGFAISPSRLKFELNEKNFLGLGHGFQNGFTWNHSNGNNAFISDYSIPNIRNTYINTSLHYGTDESANSVKSLNIERPFFSPFAKWAAGTSLEQQSRKDTLLQGDSIYQSQDYKFNRQDHWGAISYRIFNGNSEDERTTNLIAGLRFLQVHFLQKPDKAQDPAHFYSNEVFYLAGIGISTRKYIQDRYIFNYGFIEDVAIGKVIGITGGYQIKNNSGRYYMGLRFSIGNYNNWGYLSSNFEYGTFFKGNHIEQSVFTVGMNYFTDIIEIGKWKFRQFIKPRITLGFNRLPSDKISINEEKGIPGLNSTFLRGTRKAVLTLQTQSYAPWNIIGFRFGPYLTCSLGMLGDEVTGFQKSKIYSQFGFGLLIKNEFLVFEKIEISFAFYPSIPGIGDNIFKVNPDKTTDFGFQNFELGKPAIVPYQ